MSLASVSEVQTVNPRIQALLERHETLSIEIEEAQKNLSTKDHYLKLLKKRKLIVKEKIADEERRASQ
ncbi:MAG: DUF465 domain-containing protein [Alphaproteobacteria bacterium]|nr:DUF465 domain-containing protein [Alphaproteobacteria bacterium]